MKKIILTIFVFFIIFLIYFFNRNEKVYYLSLGDYLSYGVNNFNRVDKNYSIDIKNYHKKNLKNYVNYSNCDDYRVMDLINDINYNKTVSFASREYKLQNLLIKSNLITLSIGMNDLIYKQNYDIDLYDYTDQLLGDIESLFILLRKYNKDKIYFLSFYNVINNKDIIEYANKKLQFLCKKNKIDYVDISTLNQYIIKDRYPTSEGYSYISDKILNFTK